MWRVVDQNPDILKYFPDGDDRERISRKWLLDVSVVPLNVFKKQSKRLQGSVASTISLMLHRYHVDAPFPEAPRIRGVGPGHDQEAQGVGREEGQPPRQHEGGVRGEAGRDPAHGHGKWHHVVITRQQCRSPGCSVFCSKSIFDNLS